MRAKLWHHNPVDIYMIHSMSLIEELATLLQTGEVELMRLLVGIQINTNAEVRRRRMARRRSGRTMRAPRNGLTRLVLPAYNHRSSLFPGLNTISVQLCPNASAALYCMFHDQGLVIRYQEYAHANFWKLTYLNLRSTDMRYQEVISVLKNFQDLRGSTRGSLLFHTKENTLLGRVAKTLRSNSGTLRQAKLSLMSGNQRQGLLFGKNSKSGTKAKRRSGTLVGNLLTRQINPKSIGFLWIYSSGCIRDESSELLRSGDIEQNPGPSIIKDVIDARYAINVSPNGAVRVLQCADFDTRKKIWKDFMPHGLLTYDAKLHWQKEVNFINWGYVFVHLFRHGKMVQWSSFLNEDFKKKFLQFIISESLKHKTLRRIHNDVAVQKLETSEWTKQLTKQYKLSWLNDALRQKFPGRYFSMLNRPGDDRTLPTELEMREYQQDPFKYVEAKVRRKFKLMIDSLTHLNNLLKSKFDLFADLVRYTEGAYTTCHPEMYKLILFINGSVFFKKVRLPVSQEGNFLFSSVISVTQTWEESVSDLKQIHTELLGLDNRQLALRDKVNIIINKLADITGSEPLKAVTAGGGISTGSWKAAMVLLTDLFQVSVKMVDNLGDREVVQVFCDEIMKKFYEKLPIAEGNEGTRRSGCFEIQRNLIWISSNYMSRENDEGARFVRSVAKLGAARLNEPSNVSDISLWSEILVRIKGAIGADACYRSNGLSAISVYSEKNFKEICDEYKIDTKQLRVFPEEIEKIPDYYNVDPAEMTVTLYEFGWQTSNVSKAQSDREKWDFIRDKFDGTGWSIEVVVQVLGPDIRHWPDNIKNKKDIIDSAKRLKKCFALAAQFTSPESKSIVSSGIGTQAIRKKHTYTKSTFPEPNYEKLDEVREWIVSQNKTVGDQFEDLVNISGEFEDELRTDWNQSDEESMESVVDLVDEGMNNWDDLEFVTEESGRNLVKAWDKEDDSYGWEYEPDIDRFTAIPSLTTLEEDEMSTAFSTVKSNLVFKPIGFPQTIRSRTLARGLTKMAHLLSGLTFYRYETGRVKIWVNLTMETALRKDVMKVLKDSINDVQAGLKEEKDRSKRPPQNEILRLMKEKAKLSKDFRIFTTIRSFFDEQGISELALQCEGLSISEISEMILRRILDSSMRKAIQAVLKDVTPFAILTPEDKVEKDISELAKIKKTRASKQNFKPSDKDMIRFQGYIDWLGKPSGSSQAAITKARGALYTKELYESLQELNRNTVYEVGLQWHESIMEICEGSNAFNMGILMNDIANVAKTYISSKQRYGLAMFKLHHFPAVLILNSRKTRTQDSYSSDVSARILLLGGGWGFKNSNRGLQASIYCPQLSNPFILNNRILTSFTIALRSSLISSSLWAQNKGLSLSNPEGRSELLHWFKWTMFYCLDGTRISQKISGNFRYIMITGQDGAMVDAKGMGKKMSTPMRRTSHYVMVKRMKETALEMFSSNNERVQGTDKFWKGEPSTRFLPIRDYLTGLSITSFPCMHLVMYRYHHTSKIIPDMVHSKKAVGLKSIEGYYRCVDEYAEGGDRADAIRGFPTGDSDWSSLHSSILNKTNKLGGSRKVCAAASRWTIKLRGKQAYDNWKERVNVNKGISDLMNNTAITESVTPQLDTEKAQKFLRRKEGIKTVKRCVKHTGRMEEAAAEKQIEYLYNLGILKNEEDIPIYKKMWSKISHRESVDSVLSKFTKGAMAGTSRRESILNLSVTIKHLARDFKQSLSTQERALIRQELKKPIADMSRKAKKNMHRSSAFYHKAKQILSEQDFEDMILKYIKEKDLFKISQKINHSDSLMEEVREVLEIYGSSTNNPDDPTNNARYADLIAKIQDVRGQMRCTEDERRLALAIMTFFLGSKASMSKTKEKLRGLMTTHRVDRDIHTDNAELCLTPTLKFFKSASRCFSKVGYYDGNAVELMTTFRLVFTELLTRSSLSELIQSSLTKPSTDSLSQLGKHLDVVYLYLPPEQHCFYMLNACLTCHEKSTFDLGRITGRSDNEVTLSFAKKTKVTFMLATLVSQCLKSRDKASSNIIRLADNTCYQKEPPNVSVVAKAQPQDNRDLGVLRTDAKIANYVVERIVGPLAAANGNDVVTEPKMKYKFVADSVRLDDAPTYDSKGLIKSFAIWASEDKSKWGPNHIPHLFTSTCRPYYSFIGNAWYLADIQLLKMSLKRCEIVPPILAICLRDDYEYGRDDTMDRIRDYIMETGNMYVTKESDMIQGILHTTSSLVHSTALYYSHEIIRRAFARRGVVVKGTGNSGSDDSAIKVRIEFEHGKTYDECKRWAKRVMECYIRVFRLFNMVESPKSVYCWKTIELNSLTNNCSRFYMPDIRNVTQQFAPMPLRSHSDIQTKFVSMAQSGIMSSGLPISVIQQFWLFFQGYWLQQIGLCPGPKYPFQREMLFKLPLEFGLVKPHLLEIVGKSPMAIDMERILKIQNSTEEKWKPIKNLLTHCKINLRYMPGLKRPLEPTLLTVGFKRVIGSRDISKADALKQMRESLETGNLGFVQEQILSLCVPNSVEADALRLFRVLDSPDAMKDLNESEKMRCVAELHHQYNGHFTWVPETMKLKGKVSQMERGPGRILIRYRDFLDQAMRESASTSIEGLMEVAQVISSNVSPMVSTIERIETAPVVSYTSGEINSYGMFDVNMTEGKRIIFNDPFHLMMLMTDEDCFVRNVAGTIDFSSLKTDIEIMKGILGPYIDKMIELAKLKNKESEMDNSDIKFVKNTLEMLMMIRNECTEKKMKILGPLYPKITNFDFFRFYITDNNLRGVKLSLGLDQERTTGNPYMFSLYEEIVGAVSVLACTCSNTSEVQKMCQKMRNLTKIIEGTTVSVDKVLNHMSSQMLPQRKRKELLIVKSLFGDQQSLLRLASMSKLRVRQIKISDYQYSMQVDKLVGEIDLSTKTIYCNSTSPQLQMQICVLLLDWLHKDKILQTTKNFMYDIIPDRLITKNVFQVKLHYDGPSLQLGRTTKPGILVEFKQDIIPDRNAIIRHIEPISFVECSPGSINVSVCLELDTTSDEVDTSQTAAIAMSGSKRTHAIKSLPDIQAKKSVAGFALPQRVPYRSLSWLLDVGRSLMIQKDRFTMEQLKTVKKFQSAVSLEWDPKMTTMVKGALARVAELDMGAKREAIIKEYTGLTHILDMSDEGDDISAQLQDIVNRQDQNQISPVLRLEDDMHAYSLSGPSCKMSVSTLSLLLSMPFHEDMISSYSRRVEQGPGTFWLDLLAPVFSHKTRSVSYPVKPEDSYVLNKMSDKRDVNSSVALMFFISRLSEAPEWKGTVHSDSFTYKVTFDADHGKLLAMFKWNEKDLSPNSYILIQSLRLEDFIKEVPNLDKSERRTSLLQVRNLQMLRILLRKTSSF
uniref:RNA-dependent RNA polymerase n=1 Tax=Beihai bunya-like virus 3 TaxID=1922373 RepID=A0A1L3KPI5_9VIRU|nr:RNA-dependent RNA polymerase [Beihai bunya-like virus 3]